MSARASYRLAPDGLRARQVRRWNARKHYLLSRYMSMFATSMTKWEHRVYIDLFSGPGMCFNKDTAEFVQGSPLIATRYKFTKLIFADIDGKNCAALETRIATGDAAIPTVVIPGDCNDVIDRVIAEIPTKDCLTLAFIDPTGWQIRFDTIKRLTERRRADILLTFHVWGMKLNWDSRNPALDEFLGVDSRWRTDLRGKSPESWEFLQRFRNNMSGIGYARPPDAIDLPIHNSQNRLLYYMTLFARHPLAYDFWRKTVGEADEVGQQYRWPT